MSPSCFVPAHARGGVPSGSMQSSTRPRSAAIVALLATTALTGCGFGSLGRPSHDVALWTWYRSTDPGAERDYLETLRRLCSRRTVQAGLRLARAHHERRVGDPKVVPDLLVVESVEHPSARLLIERLAARWGIEVAVDSAAAVRPSAGAEAREEIVLLLPTRDARPEAGAAAVADPLPVDAFDATTWSAASQPGRYVVPIQVSLEVLESVSFPWEAQEAARLPVDALVGQWGVEHAIATRVTQWQRRSPSQIRYELNGRLYGLLEAAGLPEEARAPIVLVERDASSTARGEEQREFAGAFLEDNPLGIENERPHVQRSVRPIDADELAIRLQREIVSTLVPPRQ
jgi:hypothetical protein